MSVPVGGTQKVRAIVEYLGDFGVSGTPKLAASSSGAAAGRGQAAHRP
jgi:hypothetical protein